ncbi:MAG: hypothetical protein IPK66_05080 [Rhodospirillales bacterium]|nr:hypothetical protein [Rhodospirillales bacterium]
MPIRNAPMSTTITQLIRAASVVAVLIPAAVRAADSPLSESEVARVIATTHDLAPLSEKYRDELRALAQSESAKGTAKDGHKDPCDIPAAVKAHPGMQEMEKTIKSHGYKNGEQYCRASLKVFAACSAVRAEQQNPNWRDELAHPEQRSKKLDEQLQQAIAKVDADTSMPDEQKQRMVQQMTAMVQQMKSQADSPMVKSLLAVSDAEMKVVAPSCPDLERSAQAPHEPHP